jgi:hypothetical protein
MKGAQSGVAGICRLTISIIAIAALTACNSGGSSKKYTIGGTISGLTGTVVLQNNGSDSLTTSTNGSFTFAGKVKKNKPYAVTVTTQPAGQTCVVTNGAGTATANVTNVTVTCTTNPTYSVGGNVSGLSGTVVLRNNGGDNLSVSASGAFTFATRLASGAAYAVTVLTQPAGQTCVVTQGTGVIASADVTTVVVTCTNNPPPPTTYSIGGSVSGLAASTTVVLQNNGGNNLSIGADGAFTFSNQLASGAAYSVTVLTQPAGQTCSVTNGAGTVANANVTNVTVNCVASTTTYTIGGTITGLTGAGLRIENGPTRSASPASGATTFTLSDVVQTGFEYDVGISQQPAGQTCVLIKSHGIVNNANVTNVDVRCIANVTNSLRGTYTALGLVPGSYIYITLFDDGVYIYGSIEDNPGATGCGQNDGNGVEYGVYNYNSGTGAFEIMSALVDTNGRCGLWDAGPRLSSGNVARTGSGTSTVLTLTGTLTNVGPVSIVLTAVASTSGQVTGSWAFPYEKNFVVFLPAGGLNFYDMVTETQQDTPPTNAAGFLAGVEYACASVSALTGGTLTPDFSATCQPPRPSGSGAVDLSGGSGLSSAGATVPFTISTDTLTSGDLVLTRIRPN